MTFRDKERESYVIQIGDNFTKSYCYQTFYFDSIVSGGDNAMYRRLEDYMIKNPPQKPPGENSEEYNDGLDAILSRGWFSFYVYKDYKKEKITVTDVVHDSHNSYFIYEEELKPQDWTVLGDTMTVLGYSCRKAKCSYQGRDWEAWFAPDIPINEGPWKFYGLPGLIMKLEDSESHYCFEISGLQHVNEPMYMAVHKNSRNIDRLSFLKLSMGRTGIDLAAMDHEKVGINVGSSVKHYDHIERDYK